MMEQEHKKDHIDRMCALAIAYIEDADALSAQLANSSDGAYLLRLLAFEILLKAVRLAHGLQPIMSHSYQALFESLPSEVQRRLLSYAESRTGSGADSSDPDYSGPDYSDPGTLLDTFGKNFSKLRYSYESYEGLTAGELRGRESQWLAAGAKTKDATFKYYPEELFGLTEALRAEIASLQSQSGA